MSDQPGLVLTPEERAVLDDAGVDLSGPTEESVRLRNQRLAGRTPSTSTSEEKAVLCPSELLDPNGKRHNCDLPEHEGSHRKQMQGYALTWETQDQADPLQGTVIYFVRGPWAGKQATVERVVGPVFAVGHEVGGHYWLDTESDPPNYHWDPR